VVHVAFGGHAPPTELRAPLAVLMVRVVVLLQDTIDVLDFWRKPIEVKKLRGAIDTEILLDHISALNAIHECLAFAIVKLAEK